MAEIYSRLGIIYNGWDMREDGFIVTDPPEIPAAERDIEYLPIQGRDGSVSIDKGRYNDVDIPVQLAFDCREETWGDMFRFLKQQLSGSGELFFYDDDNFFRMVRKASVVSGVREAVTLGSATANFHCDPYEYLVKGKKEITSGYSTLRNKYGETAKPLYRLYKSGGGNCTLTVNSKAMTAQVPASGLYIDTELMIAYNANSHIYANGLVNGKYEDMWLKPGDNTISVTSGFTIGITPRWRTL